MRLLVSLALACVLAVPPLHAAHPPGCGSGWVGAKSCHFKIGGLRLRVSGSATATGSAKVRVWISPIVAGTHDVALVECSAGGRGSAACSAEIPLPANIEPGEIVLACRVAGVTFGTYRCETRM